MNHPERPAGSGPSPSMTGRSGSEPRIVMVGGKDSSESDGGRSAAGRPSPGHPSHRTPAQGPLLARPAPAEPERRLPLARRAAWGAWRRASRPPARRAAERRRDGTRSKARPARAAGSIGAGGTGGARWGPGRPARRRRPGAPRRSAGGPAPPWPADRLNADAVLAAGGRGGPGGRPGAGGP